MKGIMIALSVCATGCVAHAQVTLQRPVKRQCDSAGLDACDQLTRGTLLFAEGKALAGRKALTSGLDANESRSTELEQFAKGLESLGNAPQTDEYSVRLQPAIEMILDAAGKGPSQTAVPRPLAASAGATPRAPLEAKAQPSETNAEQSAESRAESSATITSSPKRVLSGFIGGHAEASGKTNIVPCRLGDGTPGWCIFQPVMMRGYITDLVVSQACERDVFVLEGSPARPTWLVWSSANKGLSAHDLRLPVQSGGTLIVGVVTKGSEAARQWLWRCGVNWTQTAGR